MQWLSDTPFLKQILSIVIIVFFLVVILGILQHIKISDQNPVTISFDGVGRVVITHDTATVRFTFSEISKDVTQAREGVSKQVDSAYTAIRQLDIQDRDITTTAYTINPEYSYPRDRLGNSKRVLDGYRVSHTSFVRIRDIENAGAVLDAISTRNPHRIGDLTFMLDEEQQEQVEEEAIILAIRNAQEKSKRIAQGSNLDLRRLVDIQIHKNNNTAKRSSLQPQALHFESTALSAPTQIVQGENIVQSSVVLTYELR